MVIHRALQFLPNSVSWYKGLREAFSALFFVWMDVLLLIDSSLPHSFIHLKVAVEDLYYARHWGYSGKKNILPVLTTESS